MSREEVETLLARYTTETTPIANAGGKLNHLNVDILEDGRKIGSYVRDYRAFLKTFAPFVLDDQVYALYSPQYTTTRIMRLPDCGDLGGEEMSGGGFCPAEYYIPYDPAKGLDGTWGFMSGCVWGDDRCWKVRFIDLSQAALGVFRSESKFGYLPIPDKLSLREAADVSWYDADSGEIEFSVRRVYSMVETKFDDEESPDV